MNLQLLYLKYNCLANEITRGISKNKNMDITWYNELNKPFLNPPSNIFAPVWAVIYLLIFLSFFIFMFAKTDKDKKAGIGFFLIQLLLNFSWSPVFFYFHNIKLSLIIIILLLIFIILTVYAFYKVSKSASYLLVPYLIWTSFAAYLNFGLMILN